MKHTKPCSAEHARFLRRRRRNIGLIWACRIGLLAALLGVWELVAALGWVDPFITSSPSRIAGTIASLYREGSLFYHIGVTLWETLAGFALAVAHRAASLLTHTASIWYGGLPPCCQADPAIFPT